MPVGIFSSNAWIASSIRKWFQQDKTGILMGVVKSGVCSKCGCREEGDMAWNEVRRIAVLIDADNTAISCLEEVLTELSLRGRIIVKRAYGNWKKEELKNWPDEMNRLAIRAMQQFDYVAGKNATDIALVIDALDLLYTENYDAFALVSSDSDYTPLAIRLHESGAYVYGFGKSNTSKSFVNACDEFVLLENLMRTSHRNRGGRPIRKNTSQDAARSSKSGEAALEGTKGAKGAEAAHGGEMQKPARAGETGRESVPESSKTPKGGEIAPEADKFAKGGEAIPESARAAKSGQSSKSTRGVESAQETDKAERTGESAKSAWGSESAQEADEAKRGGESVRDARGGGEAAQEEVSRLEVSEEELSEIHGLLHKIWEDNQNDDGFVYNSLAGILLRRIKPDFDPRTYGEKRLSDLLRRYPDHYEIVESENGHRGYYCVD